MIWELQMIYEDVSMDAQYMDAVKRGDKETAQRMVDDVIMKTIPNINRVNFLDIRGNQVEVIKNASRRERKSLESDQMVGEILFPNGDTLSFNRMLALHGEILNKLNIKNTYIITGLLYRDGFLITDRTGGGLQESPKTSERVEMKYKVDAFNYDESIVGDWKNLESSQYPLDAVIYDDQGNIIPISQRFRVK
jgi:hypothetical protein